MIQTHFVLLTDMSRKYVMFTENNDWEGESWDFFIQYDGNEEELKALYDNIHLHDLSETYELNLSKIIPEYEVDFVLKYAKDGYMMSHNKISGKLKFSERVMTSYKDYDSPKECTDSLLNKGGIEDMYV